MAGYGLQGVPGSNSARRRNMAEPLGTHWAPWASHGRSQAKDSSPSGINRFANPTCRHLQQCPMHPDVEPRRGTQTWNLGPSRSVGVICAVGRRAQMWHVSSTQSQ